MFSATAHLDKQAVVEFSATQRGRENMTATLKEEDSARHRIAMISASALKIPTTGPDHEIFQTLHSAEQVATRLRSLINSLGPSFRSKQFYIRVRVKSYESIGNKIYQKRLARPTYSLSHLTDIVGLRIVTLSDDDLKDAIEHLLHILETSRGFHEPLFSGRSRWDCVREVRFYKRHITESGQTDIYEQLYNELQSTLTKDIHPRQQLSFHREKFELVEPDIKTYSSAHFVLNAVGYGSGTSRVVPIEVQVRTVAEDVWAELNHKLLYKAKDLYVWSKELAGSYHELDIDSKSLKSAVIGLRDHIERFQEHSNNASRAVDYFLEPQSLAHASLVVTLLCALGGDGYEFNDLDDNNGEGTNIRDALGDYNRKLRQLLERTRKKRDCARILADCVRLFEKMKARFKKSLAQQYAKHSLAANTVLSDVTKNEKLNDETKNSITLINQHIILCDLEIVRLRISCAERYNYEIKPSGFSSIGRNKDTRSHLFGTWFDELCRIKNHVDLRIRPMCLILYWKYYVARHYSEKLALEHLNAAWEHLPFDSTLPEWSVYRVLIPRTLATELHDQVETAVRRLAERRTRAEVVKSAASIGILEKANTAARLAVIGFRPYEEVPNGGRRGDIIFGLQESDRIADADLLINILSENLHNFGRIDVTALDIEVEKLVSTAKSVLRFTKSNKYISERQPEKIKRARLLIPYLHNWRKNNPETK